MKILTAFTIPHGANGGIQIKLGWAGANKTITVIGGPYDNRPAGSFGVCVRAERVRPNNVHLPIHDFSVPTDDAAVREALRQTIKAALDGRQVYVGCMGGWGRTGLFLSLVAKVAGVEEPVGFVRRNYTPRAVETREQFDYVEGFDVSKLRRWMYCYAWTKRIPFLGMFCN